MTGNRGCRLVQRLTLLLFGFLFLLSGPAWVWADCSRHIHLGAAEEDHLVVRDLDDAGHAHHDDRATKFHCPPPRFDTQAVVSLQVSLKPKPRQGRHTAITQGNLFADQASLANSINNAEKRSFYPFLTSASPHLLLSVLRI